MAELHKIVRVVKKLDESAPHKSLLVLDATSGQNVFHQVKNFKEIAGVDGLIITKLDGTARAGFLVSLVEQFHLPIYYIGVGERVDDLGTFSAKGFADAILG